MPPFEAGMYYAGTAAGMLIFFYFLTYHVWPSVFADIRAWNKRRKEKV